MMRAAMRGASASIFSSESLPRVSNWQSLAATQVAERRSPSSTAISPKARPLRRVAISTSVPLPSVLRTETTPRWRMHMKVPASPSLNRIWPSFTAVRLK